MNNPVNNLILKRLSIAVLGVFFLQCSGAEEDGTSISSTTTSTHTGNSKTNTQLKTGKQSSKKNTQTTNKLKSKPTLKPVQIITRKKPVMKSLFSTQVKLSTLNLNSNEDLSIKLTANEITKHPNLEVKMELKYKIELGSGPQPKEQRDKKFTPAPIEGKLVILENKTEVEKNVIIPKEYLHQGRNAIAVTFVAVDQEKGRVKKKKKQYFYSVNVGDHHPHLEDKSHSGSGSDGLLVAGGIAHVLIDLLTFLPRVFAGG